MILQEKVITEFKQNFSKYKDEKIAIYGLGKNTENLLNHIRDYTIIALMDEVRIGQTVFGLPVISCEEAYNMGIRKIIIIAREANVPIIYHRIFNVCSKLGIAIYDLHGNKLGEEIFHYVCPNKYTEITEEILKVQICECDVVSFDIFDTLLMRKVLYPTDIFYIVEKKAKEQKVIHSDYNFYQERIQTERELYLQINPTIYEIYAAMVFKGSITRNTANKLMELEIEEEMKQIIVRQDMLNLLNFALDLNKKVCCTSDMYLTHDLLSKILAQNHITGIDRLFVSCEYKSSKSERLFQIVKEAYPNKDILHIGDNSESDIYCAVREGINHTFHIESSLQMLMDSAISHIMKYSDTLANRIYIGSFIAKQFNSPFLFNYTNGKCRISHCDQLGDYMAPLFLCFSKWLIQEIEKEGINLILFGARDGWFMQQVFNYMESSENRKIASIYFYTSRQSCILAGMETVDDILEVFELPFTGTVKEKLLIRYGLDEDELLVTEKNESDKDYVLRHGDCILEHIKQYKKGYKYYRSQLPIDDSSKIAYFDFVSSGTCQKWLSKLFGWNLNGFYFLKIHDEKKKELVIHSMYPEEGLDEANSFLSKNYFILEYLISSIEPSLRCFDQNGNKIFEQENRSIKQREDIVRIQKAIMSVIQEQRVYNDDESVSKEMADTILSFITKQYSVVDIDFFEDINMKDEFCNREFEVKTI